MGTSKSYIAPTSPEWTLTKRAITSLTKNHSEKNRLKVVDRYSKALQIENLSTSSFPLSISQFIGLINSVRLNGTESALIEHGFENLVKKSSYDIFNTILNHYSNGNSTIDDHIIIDCLSKMMENLNINDLDDFNKIANEIILKELIINYIQIKFEQMFEERIMANCSPEDGLKIMSDINEYLRDHLTNTLNIDDLSKIDFMNIQGQEFIIDTCKKTYELLKSYETE